MSAFLVCDFYGTDIKIDFDDKKAKSLGVIEPFVKLISDEGFEDYFMLIQEEFLLDVFDQDEKIEIKEWCKEYKKELVDIWRTKQPKLLPNVQKEVSYG